jgi:ring-1,2-phenylacetyl-CoA epoxidase subunit PaaD
MVIARDTSVVFKLLTTVKDPEIPVLNVVDMGVIRRVEIVDDTIEVDITPTYSGCPAMDVIAANVRTTLEREFSNKVKIDSVMFPPWTTDWLTEDAREKLMAYGISPPEKNTTDKSLLFGHREAVVCPKCKSTNTERISEFGSTACKAHYRCADCKEPFDHFKCI